MKASSCAADSGVISVSDGDVGAAGWRVSGRFLSPCPRTSLLCHSRVNKRGLGTPASSAAHTTGPVLARLAAACSRVARLLGPGPRCCGRLCLPSAICKVQNHSQRLTVEANGQRKSIKCDDRGKQRQQYFTPSNNNSNSNNNNNNNNNNHNNNTIIELRLLFH